jgi:hypothetical protein
MILCHVSFDLTANRRFNPRVPERRNGDEDGKTARICVSKTIEGALSATPEGGSELDYNLTINQNLIKLYIIDTEKLKIKKENIISSEDLYVLNKVIDANWTEEYWILEDFEVPKEDTKIIYIKNYEYRSQDYYPYLVEQELFSSKDGNIEDIWDDFFPETNLPCITLIDCLVYEEVDLKKLNFKDYDGDCYGKEFELKYAEIKDSILIQAPLDSFLCSRQMENDLKELEEGIVYIKEWV